MTIETSERPTYAEAIASLSIGDPCPELTEPRGLKLTVDDLVLLDRHWDDDYHKSTELIDGRIYFTPARFRPRSSVAQEIWVRLRESAAVVAPHLFVAIRGSVEVSPYDLPLPDIVLTSEIEGDAFIPAASVSLVVEVAETAVDFYLGEKMRMYGRAGIPEYWVADIKTDSIKRFHEPTHEPTKEGYGKGDVIPFGSSCASIILPSLRIETNGLT